MKTSTNIEYRKTVKARITAIKEQLSAFDKSETATTKDLYSLWRSEEVQYLKDEFEQMGVEPPTFKRLIGLIGRKSDLAFSGYDMMTFKDLN